MHPATKRNTDNHTASSSRFDAPFSMKFSLLLTLLVSIGLPLILMLPLVVIHWLGFPLSKVGITADTFGSFVFVIQFIALFITIYLISKKLEAQRLTWASLGLKRARAFQAIRYIAGYYLLLIVLMISISVIFSIFNGGIPEPAEGKTGGTTTLALFGGFWLTFVATVIIGPVVEEIVFRGILFPALRQRFGIISGVIGSSILFTLVHFDPIVMISVLPMGVYLAIMYQRTKSIYPGIFLHASWNLLVLLIANSAA